MGTFGDARGTGGACRAELANLVVLDVDWFVLRTELRDRSDVSASEESGVVGRDAIAKDGRRSDVKDGDGGNGFGGLL